MPAPTNVHAIKTDLDGRFVEIAWDEAAATGTAVIARYRFFTLGTDGVTWFETPYTYHLTDKVAVVPGGKTIRVQNVSQAGNQYASADFAVPAATTPPPPPTEHQSLEAALGITVADGSKVAVYTAAESGTDPAQGDWFAVGTPDLSPMAAPMLPPPPPTLNDRQKLESALAVTLTTGDKVAIYPNPATVQTVNADGSVS